MSTVNITPREAEMLREIRVNIVMQALNTDYRAELGELLLRIEQDALANTNDERPSLTSDGRWMPISTAPEGRDVWVGNEHNMRLAFWIKGAHAEHHGSVGGGWFDHCASEQGRGPRDLHFAPTHWMPLPALPPGPVLAMGDASEEAREGSCEAAKHVASNGANEPASAAVRVAEGRMQGLADWLRAMASLAQSPEQHNALSGWASEVESIREAVAPAQAAGQQPVAYQILVDGKWVECSYFVAFGWGDAIAPTCRALYTHPTPAAPAGREALQEVTKLAASVEAAGYRRGLARRAPSDHEPEISALIRYVAALASSPCAATAPPKETPYGLAQRADTITDGVQTTDGGQRGPL